MEAMDTDTKAQTMTLRQSCHKRSIKVFKVVNDTAKRSIALIKKFNESERDEK